jgi:hypothetical protein
LFVDVPCPILVSSSSLSSSSFSSSQFRFFAALCVVVVLVVFVVVVRPRDGATVLAAQLKAFKSAFDFASTNPMSETEANDVAQEDDNAEAVNAEKKESFVRARNRWQLAYTLVNNPEVIKYRNTSEGAPPQKAGNADAGILEDQFNRSCEFRVAAFIDGACCFKDAGSDLDVLVHRRRDEV